MKRDEFTQRMQSFHTWKVELANAIQSYQSWLEEHDPDATENELSIFEALEALRKDSLNVAFVAEFSRGKTELINAIFFAEFGQRLLPSEAGRTTMCPTELFYDREQEQAYIRLLPIETRAEESSISELKHETLKWTTIPLDVSSPERTAETLREVVRTKLVPLEQARRLGLYDESQDPQFNQRGGPPADVEVPMWRHAMISFPHPLLKQGLVILDTPGLNALGSEPELTLHMLPSAQAVLFILAADSGVTRSDLDIWQHHVHGARGVSKQGVVVVLNKIDPLWDDLKDESGVTNTIAEQQRKTAQLLNVDADCVFPLSAHKGLLAKIRGNTRLLEMSRLQVLEQYLSEQVLPAKEEIVRERILREVGGQVAASRAVVQGELQQTQKQLTDLRSLRGKNAEVIQHLMRKSREEQATYLRNVESFQSSRRVLQNQAKGLLDALSLQAFDELTTRSRQQMSGSWTTAGLKRCMKTLFDGVRETMEQALTQAEQTRMLIRATYRKFHEEHGLPAITPKVFSIERYTEQINRFAEEAEVFRKSPVTTMTEQSFVIKKFFISVVSQARNVLFNANRDAEIWLKEVMTPLIRQIKEHKQNMEKRLDTLRRISESRETLEGKIRELERMQKDLSQDMEVLDGIHARLQHPVSEQSAAYQEPAADLAAV